MPTASEILNHCPWNELRLWMHYQGVYMIPSDELITFLQNEIGDKSAIEIGCGLGLLSHFLKIPATDSMCQNDPEVNIMYSLMGQPTIKYPEFVEKLEALEAVEKYKPDVVIGSWITRWIDPDLPPPEDGFGGSMFGVREDLLIPKVKKYIHIGSEAIHGYKLKLNPTRIIKPDWIVSRSNRKDNVIYIWEK